MDPELKGFLEQMEVRLNAHTDARLDVLDKSLNARIDAVSQNLNLLIDSVSQSLGREIQELGKRVDRMDARLERVETRMSSIEMQLVGINRSLDKSYQEQSEVTAVQKMQQKVIDDLVARVAKLEGKERAN